MDRVIERAVVAAVSTPGRARGRGGRLCFSYSVRLIVAAFGVPGGDG